MGHLFLYLQQISVTRIFPLTENELHREGVVNKMPRLGNRVTKDEQYLEWSLVYPETHDSPLVSAFGAGAQA